jgi:Flp pilus assembly protein TadG
MRLRGPRLAGGLWRGEGGQVLPMMALMMTVLLGITGLSVDVGHALYCEAELQAATDAAALAGAQALPSTSAITAAQQYSALTGSANANTNLINVTMSVAPQPVCLNFLKNLGEACAAPTYANGIVVQEQAQVPLYFAGLFGFKTYTIKAESTAAMRGSTPTPYNVAIILDTTLSMNGTDDDCSTPTSPNVTEMQCELNGVQVLLQALTPCPDSLASCGTAVNGKVANSVDRISLFVFPDVTTDTVSIDSSCTTQIQALNQVGYSSQANTGPYTYFGPLQWNIPFGAVPWYGVPTAGPYSSPPAGASSYSPTSIGWYTSTGQLLQTDTVTYQVVPFSSDYRTSDTATTLNPVSALVKASGGSPGCNGILPSNYDGMEGTNYAGALYAAQSALVAEKAANPGSQNVIILLSDGDANVAQSFNDNVTNIQTMPTPANSSGHYPSYVGDCGQGIVAANAATTAGTRVSVVGYGAPQTGCSTDVNAGQYPNVTPCAALQAMASSAQTFYSDYTQTGSNSNCISAQHTVSNISTIFQQIAHDLTVARLIPNGTT